MRKGWIRENRIGYDMVGSKERKERRAYHRIRQDTIATGREWGNGADGVG